MTRRAVLLTLALAAVFHLLAVIAVPYAVMRRVSAVLADRAGGVNIGLHAPRQDASAREVVRPSPDVLYTACAFDVSQGPVRLAGPLPATYASLALFADNTDVFFVANDRDVGGRIDVYLVGRDSRATAPPGAMLVRAPSDRGVALFRTFIDDERRLPELDAARREQSCEPA